MTRILVAASLALGLAAGTAAAGDDFYWKGPVAKGKTVEIKGVNGSIRAERTSGKDVEVKAEKHAKKSDPASVEIQTFTTANGITFCALYPDSRHSSEPNSCEPGDHSHMSTDDNDVQVEFRVLLPDGVDLDAHTVNGEVRVTDVTGDIEATTVNGSVVVDTRGYAEATTVNGNVDVTMTNTGWPESLEFRTVNGSIRVQMPGAINANLRAETLNGDIDSDYPITAVGKIKKRSLRGTIGNGGSGLYLATVNGDIELREGQSGASK